MEVIDLSWNDSLNKRSNSPLLPKSIRGLIVGKPGCGKTTLLLNLLLRPGWLDYNNLRVFGKSLFQPDQQILKKAFNEKLSKAILRLFNCQDDIGKLGLSSTWAIEELAKESDNKNPDIDCEFFESEDDVPDPRELSSEKKNLMIFDDLQLEKQNMCEKYYVRGRHNNMDCFYLAQNYFKLPRQTIRENANFFCLFPQDTKNITPIYQDHVSMDMPMEEFKSLFKAACRGQHGFVVMDHSSQKNNRIAASINSIYHQRYKTKRFQL